MKKSTTFHKERLLFLFNFFLRFHAANIKEFCSTTSYLCSKFTAKTYEQKDFFLAIDAETQSSNKEENEKEMCFFIYLCAK